MCWVLKRSVDRILKWPVKPNDSQGIRLGYGVDGPGLYVFIFKASRPFIGPIFCSVDTGARPPAKGGLGVSLNPRSLEPRLRLQGAVSPFAYV